jgi:hypothetical protein
MRKANVAISRRRRDLGGEQVCPVRERDGSRCENESHMWTYAHICTKHAEQLRRGRKLVLINGTRLDTPWTQAARIGEYVD